MTQTIPDTVLDVHLKDRLGSSWPPPLNVRSSGLTDPGRMRERNEDQFLISSFSQALTVQQTSIRQPGLHLGGPQGHLFVVADGVGGCVGGARASDLAVRTVEQFLLNSLHWCLRFADGPDPVLQGLRQALAQADSKLFQEAQRQPELHGMGTTLTLAAACGADLYLAHAGDSRCYLLRRDVLYQLTRDHTLTDALVRRGSLSAEEAANHSMRHVIVNVVGGNQAGVDAEVHHIVLNTGDVLLLCSDGLTEMMSDDEISQVLRSDTDTERCCRRLVDRANELGGRDNVTVVVAQFE
jgi:protein phosphatase